VATFSKDWSEGNDYHRFEIDNGFFNDKPRGGPTIQTKLSKTYRLEGRGTRGEGERMQWTERGRENDTNYSGFESKGKSKQYSKGEKKQGSRGFGCREDEEGTGVSVTSLKKTEMQRGEGKNKNKKAGKQNARRGRMRPDGVT
jgi:hypothetical protein